MYSIILPTYNRGYCIERAIRSLLAQTYTDVEIVVVDDGSTDDTASIVARLMQEDARVRYTYQDNAGACAARNTGMDIADGVYYIFHDSDDVVAPTFVQAIHEALASGPYSFGTVNHVRHIVLLDAQGNVVDEHTPFVVADGPVTLQDYYHWNIKTTGTGLFFSASRFRDVRWDTNLRYIEDLDVIMALGECAPDEFVFVEAPLVTYTQSYGGDGMCSNARYQDWADAFDYIYHKHAHDPLLEGQTWWPERVEKYTALQQAVDRGEHKPQVYKFFPQANV